MFLNLYVHGVQVNGQQIKYWTMEVSSVLWEKCLQYIHNGTVLVKNDISAITNFQNIWRRVDMVKSYDSTQLKHIVICSRTPDETRTLGLV